MDAHSGDELPLNLKEVRARYELEAIARALSRCEDNVSQPAHRLGVSRPTLHSLFQKHDIPFGVQND